MNVTCFYDQTPFTLSMEEKIAALRKMHAENLHHYDARCPRCGRANAISRERLEMFTPGWEEAIKAPATAPMTPAKPAVPSMSTPSMATETMPMAAPAAAPKKSATARRRHKPTAKKAARKAKPAAKKKAKKAVKKSAKKAAKKAAKKKTVRKSTRKKR